MVLTGKFPVQLSAEGRVISESQILLKINHSVLGRALDVSRRARVEPEATDPDFVRVKIIGVCCVQARCDQEQAEQSYPQYRRGPNRAEVAQLQECHRSSIFRSRLRPASYGLQEDTIPAVELGRNCHLRQGVTRG